MYTPFFTFNKTELFFLTVIFILGVISGATLLNICLSKRLDELILYNKELNVKTEQQELQINQLEEKLKIHSQQFINKITVELKTELNKHSQQEIRDEIHKKLNGLLGKELKKVDPLLLRNIINERLIMINDKTYELHLIYLVLSSELKFFIEINKK